MGYGMTRNPAPPLPAPEERRRLREARSLSEADVAAEVGVTRETVCAWEAGRTTPRGRAGRAYARLLTPTEVTDRQEAAAGVDLDASRSEGRGSRRERRQEHRGERQRERRRSVSREEARPQGRRDEAVPVPAGADARPVPLPLPPAHPPEENPVTGPGGLTPAQAFDRLYAFCAPALLRQTYLLTGRRELARESVERAFQSAWEQWPEVAQDRDPAGWVRAAAYEYALSPWHRARRRYRHPEPPPADAADRALLSALMELPPMHRRTLLLYDGVGLDLPETAAETEASTPAAANRLLHARESVSTRLPELAVPAELHKRLAEVAGTKRVGAAEPFTVRWASERRAQHLTRAAIAFTAVIIGVTSLTLRSAPDHYEPPLAPGATVTGLPPRIAPGPLSQEQLALRARLKAATASGPQRLVPDPR